MMMKVNVTLKELEQCVKFAKEHSVSEHKTITLHHDTSGGIGNSLGISKDFKSEPIDITNYESW